MFFVHIPFKFFLKFFLSKPFLPFVAWDLSLGNWMTPFLCKSGRYRSSNWRRPSHKYLQIIIINNRSWIINNSSQWQKLRKIRVYRAITSQLPGKDLISTTRNSGYQLKVSIEMFAPDKRLLCHHNFLGKTWFLILHIGPVNTNWRFHWLTLSLSFHFIVIVEILVGQFSLKLLTIRTVALTTFKVIMFQLSADSPFR